MTTAQAVLPVAKGALALSYLRKHRLELKA
jgi:hypothetical protein